MSHTKGQLSALNTGSIQSQSGRIIATAHHVEDAKRIVQCWNSHDALVEALEILLAACEESIPEFNIPFVNDTLKSAKGE